MLRRSASPTFVAVAVVSVVLAALVAPVSGLGFPSAAERWRPGLGLCGALQEIRLPSGMVACTHGPDPAPDGVDISQQFEPGRVRAGLILPDPPSGPAKAEAAASGAVPCFGDGVGGKRVLAIYARPSNRP
ncbi:MAG TPA: hypothetical protein VGL92_03255, partial [Acidimicrobiia bacterium]